MSMWRRAPEKYLSYGGELPYSGNWTNDQFTEEKDQCEVIVRNSVAWAVLTILGGFTPACEGPDTTHMTIACVARADAWVVVSALSLLKNKARGRSLQCQYQDNLLLFIPQATVQLLRTIRNRAMHISPEKSDYVERSSTWLAPGNKTMIEIFSTDTKSDPNGVQYLRIRPD